MPRRRNIFFTSDQHFSHTNCVKFDKRPFNSVEEMDEHFVKTWNKQVRKWDIVYVLGDFVWNTVKTHEYVELMKKLNGEKHLVIGNHDHISVSKAMKLGFKSACYECILKIAGQYCRVSHYPYRFGFWRNLWLMIKGRRKPKSFVKHFQKRPKNDGKWLIHGHTHSTNKVNGKAIHVGVTAWKYKLVPINELEKIILKGE